VQRQIIELLVNSYGQFRVRQLVLQIDDRKPLTLEVCELTLADGESDESQEIPLKIVHNSRTDLSWIVYAIEEYLGDLDYMRIDFDRGKDWRQDNGLEEIDSIHQWGDDVTDLRWAAMIASERILTHPRVRELMDVYYQQVSEALEDLRASHPEGIPDLLEGVRGKEDARPQLWELPRFLQEKSQDTPKPCHIIRLDRSFIRGVGDGPESHVMWQIEPQLPPISTPILGEMVLQAGPFQVFEDFGFYYLKTIHLTPLRQKEDGTWVNPTYRIFYQDEAQQNDANPGDGPRRRDLGSLISLDTPTAAHICRAIKRVLTKIWSSAPEDCDKIYEMQLLELLEAGQCDAEDKPIYDAWVALGCLNAPADDSDPSTTVDFDEDEW
jgi:hypothetical protein